MGSCPPLVVTKESGDGEEISTTVTKPCLLKSGGRKNLPLPYDLMGVIGLPLPSEKWLILIRSCSLDPGSHRIVARKSLGVWQSGILLYLLLLFFISMLFCIIFSVIPTDCIVEGEVLKLGGPFLQTWQKKHLKLYPNRLEFYTKHRDGQIAKGKGVEVSHHIWDIKLEEMNCRALPHHHHHPRRRLSSAFLATHRLDFSLNQAPPTRSLQCPLFL